MEQFPEIEDLEVVKLRKELAELKLRIEKYELVLKENDLLDTVPVTSDSEVLCSNQLQKYKEAVLKGSVLTLEEVKIVDLLIKNLFLAQGKAVPVEKDKKPKKEKFDNAKLLAIAGTKLDE